MIEPLVIVGAGPSGLSAASAARRRGVDALVLEARRPGGVWTRVPPDLRCLSPRRRDRLPDGTVPAGRGEFAEAEAVRAAWEDFTVREGFRLRTGVRALRLQEPFGADAGPFLLVTDEGAVRAARVVDASGLCATPWRPPLPGRFDGPLSHTADLQPDAVRAGERVVVIGGGNSGLEAALTCAARGAHVTICRRPQRIAAPRHGRLRWWLSGLPARWVPCAAEVPPMRPEAAHLPSAGPAIALESDAVRADRRLPADRVIFATGYRRDDDWLGPWGSATPGGLPPHRGGLSPRAGLGFVGLPCQRNRRSGFLRGIVDDAAAVVAGLLGPG